MQGNLAIAAKAFSPSMVNQVVLKGVGEGTTTALYDFVQATTYENRPSLNHE